MSRTATRRLLALSTFSGRAEAPVAVRSGLQCVRPRQFSHTSRQQADEETRSPAAPAKPNSPLDISRSLFGLAPDARPTGRAENDGLSRLSSVFEEGQASRPSRNRFESGSLSPMGGFGGQQAERHEEPHHLHVYSTKHNCHITLTKPSRDPLISMSAGNIGFKKSQRKHYDTAFQLASYVLGRIKEQGLIPQIKKLEVSLRGFGQGREAVTKALLGAEGKLLRGKIVKVSDATRLKFGGTRSPRPRRLG